MAFPTINGSNKGFTTVNASVSAIALPASIASGDRLFVAVCVDQNTGSAFDWSAGPSMSEIVALDNGTSARLEIRYRDCTGSEAGFNLGHANNMSSHLSWKYQAGTFDAGTAPAVATNTGSGNPNPDPPSLNPAGWDVEDTSWVAIGANDDGTSAYTGTPASYTPIDSTDSGAAQGTNIAGAFRNNAVAAEDPGTFTIEANEVWFGVTIATRPAGGGGGGGIPSLTGPRFGLAAERGLAA